MRRHLVATVLVLAGTWSGQAFAAAGAGEAFSGDRAFQLLEQQVALGPRVPGSAGNLALRRLILDLAGRLGFTAVPVCETVQDPLGAEEIEICSVVVTVPALAGAGAERIWYGAHFDTRPIADRDPDPARRGMPVPGANDGASGTAVLLHLMELLAERPPVREVSLLFFDGEDSGPAGDPAGFCLGSRRLARQWQDFGSPLAGERPVGIIVVDMVAERGCQIPREAYSVRFAPQWTDAVFTRAAELGLTALVPVDGPPVYDDHVPFLEQGLPAVDLIDFDYPQWHTTADSPAACAPEGMQQVGTLLLDLAYRP